MRCGLREGALALDWIGESFKLRSSNQTTCQSTSEFALVNHILLAAVTGCMEK